MAQSLVPTEGRGLAKVGDFDLQDYRGQHFTLAQFQSERCVIIAFLGTECPLAKLYAPRLAELERKYRDRGVAVLAVDSNAQDSVTEMAAFARRHELSYPFLKDVGNRLADQLGAERTPEVFLLDEQRVVRYRGRIDDQYGVGYIRNEPQRRELEEALESVLEGRPVTVPVTESVGCRIGRVAQPDPRAEVTYRGQIAGILRQHCVSCHREGDIAPFALTDYSEVAGWAEMIVEVVDQQRMPPWHANPDYGKFRNENRLTESEKDLLRRWVEAGAPEGTGSLPPLPTFAEGWQLESEPDLVIPISDRPFRVPATGEVRYQYFVVDPGFTEDRWLRAAELRAGNRAVVHHILVFATRDRRDLQGAGIQGFLAGYVPGLRVEPLPPGMGKRIPAGSKLIFQVHYTPIGSPQEDKSTLGLWFADPTTLTHEVVTTSTVQRSLRIPPNDPNYRVQATGRPLDEVQLLSFMPHMHLRGKSFRYEAWLPNGDHEILLDVPRYDFNWQTAYRLAEPRTLPEGTRIHCVATYDNSEANLNNPDPSQVVTWGDQTWDEMMIGYFDIARPIASEEEGQTRRLRQARQLISRWDADQDGILSRDETPAALRRTFDRVDVNQDGKVTDEELAEAVDRLRDGT